MENPQFPGFKPWALAQWTSRYAAPAVLIGTVELVSFPFQETGSGVWRVMARTEPGDPTTMQTFDCCDLEIKDQL